MENNEPLDITVLSSTKDIMQGAFPELVQYFIEDTTEFISQISHSISEKETGEMSIASHTISSTAKQFGAMCLAQTAKDIEIEASKEQPSFEQVKIKLDELTAEFQMVSNQLQEHI